MKYVMVVHSNMTNLVTRIAGPFGDRDECDRYVAKHNSTHSVTWAETRVLDPEHLYACR